MIALRVGIIAGALSMVALAAFVAVLAFNGDDPPESDAATSTITASPTRRPTASPTIKPTPSPATPTPTLPAVTPNPDTVQPGGDQSSGPLPDAQGNIPENVNLSPDMQRLRDELAATIADYQSLGGIQVGVAVTDLVTMETVSIGGNVPHKTGCVINLFGLLAAVDYFQQGYASPAGLGYSIKKGIGGSYPPEVANFLSAVFGSYPTGVVHARELMAGWGMKIAQFDHVPYYGGSDNPPPNILTPLETNMVLTRLYKEQLFNAEWTAYTKGVLEDSYAYVDYILPKWLPWTATVGHKIGYFWDYDGWVNNDVGIVRFTGADGNEKAYAISYFSQYAPSEYAGYSFGARISLDVWNFMAPRYGVAAQPAPPYQPPPPPPPPTASPTPPPTDTPAPTPTATPTASPTRTPTPSPSRTPSPTPSPTQTAIATVTP